MKKSIGAKTVAYPTPAWIVGTYDHEGKPNGMTIAWGGICCSDPPCIAVSVRKATYSYSALVERKAFTVNVPSEAHAEAVDFFGIASGRNTDKFAAAKFTVVKSDLVDAPYIKEFPLILECKVIHTLEIGLHTQFVGQIMDVKVEEEILAEGGLPDMEKLRPILFGPEVRAYYGIGKFLGKAFSIGKALKS